MSPMGSFFFANITSYIIGETIRKEIEMEKEELTSSLEDINKALEEQYENLSSVQAGSEESERIGNIIQKLENAKTETIKASADLESKKNQKTTNWIQAGAAIGTVVVSIVGIGAQLWTNLRLALYEENNVATSKTLNTKFRH